MLFLFSWQHRARLSVTTGKGVLQQYTTNRDKIQIMIPLSMNYNNKGASDSTQRFLNYCQLQNNNSSATSQDIRNFSVPESFIYLFICSMISQAILTRSSFKFSGFGAQHECGSCWFMMVNCSIQIILYLHKVGQEITGPRVITEGAELVDKVLMLRECSVRSGTVSKDSSLYAFQVEGLAQDWEWPLILKIPKEYIDRIVNTYSVMPSAKVSDMSCHLTIAIALTCDTMVVSVLLKCQYMYNPTVTEILYIFQRSLQTTFCEYTEKCVWQNIVTL